MRMRPNAKMAVRLVIVALAAAVSLSVSTAPAAAVATAPVSSVSTDAHLDSSTKVVPLVVGWNVASAITTLHSHGFGYTLKPPAGKTVKSPAHWTVTKQSPKAKSNAKVGTKVTLNVITTAAYIAQGIRSFYAKDYGSFTAITQSGKGTATIQLPKRIRAELVVASYSGGGKFSVTELGAGNVATKRTPVSVTGSYSGSVALGLTSAKVRTTEIRVSGAGAWRITIEPISSSPIIERPVTRKGDYVYLYSGKAAIWTVASPGHTKFVLNQISSGSYPNLAVDESGNWAGKVAIEPGPSVVEIHSNGTWTIK
jgi:hypothetical protein